MTRPVASTPSYNSGPASNSRYKLGQAVRHEKFGDGVVLQTEGDGEQERVQINFRNAGIKWLMLAYAKLDLI